MVHLTGPAVRLHDIAGWQLEQAKGLGEVAWDIETSGLSWRTDRIGTCQLAIADEVTIVQFPQGEVPPNLSALLADGATRKIFHHAPFDLRFMAHQWQVTPANVACTKIAAKIVHPGLEHASYSLKETLRSYLGVQIDKAERLSDWSSPRLSDEQLVYAARDVLYLRELLRVLEQEARERGVQHLLESSFRYLPARVELNLAGLDDVFAY